MTTDLETIRRIYERNRASVLECLETSKTPYKNLDAFMKGLTRALTGHAVLLDPAWSTFGDKSDDERLSLLAATDVFVEYRSTRLLALARIELGERLLECASGVGVRLDGDELVVVVYSESDESAAVGLPKALFDRHTGLSHRVFFEREELE